MNWKRVLGYTLLKLDGLSGESVEPVLGHKHVTGLSGIVLVFQQLSLLLSIQVFKLNSRKSHTEGCILNSAPQAQWL